MIFRGSEIPDDLMEFFEPANEAAMRDTWTLSPEPFPGSHFAVMPTEIPRRAIKAGTSERGVCPACGAPWVRTTEKRLDTSRPQTARAVEIAEAKGLTEEHIAAIRAVGATDAGKTRESMSGWGKNDDDVQRLADEAKAALGGYFREFLLAKAETTGWAPTCACGGDPVPATVLDPFLGSGTTLLVADQLGRDGIGIELNPDYARMALNRIRGDAPLFAAVEVA